MSDRSRCKLPLETGELLDKALDRARYERGASPLGAPARDTSALQTPERIDECWSAQQADALVTIANAYLSDNGEPSACTSDNYRVTVHVDRSALANGNGRSSLPIESVKRPDGRAVPSCGYRTQDTIDEGIDDNFSNHIIELSKLLNNPSAEGLLTAVKTYPTHSPPL